LALGFLLLLLSFACILVYVTPNKWPKIMGEGVSGIT